MKPNRNVGSPDNTPSASLPGWIDSYVLYAENRNASNHCRSQMIPRSVVAVLVLGLPVLILIFGVTMGASALTGAMGDAAGSYGLFWCAMAALMLMIIDSLLLLAVLGLRALDDWHDQDRP
jgi:hypothetical protein